jgi:2-dehydrotetronate isomerase
MPRFAANLTMMFNEWSFLDRFAAAADAGFSAVEFLFPYEHPPEAIAERLRASDLTLANFNLPPGDWAAGERGFAAVPGREAVFEAALETAIPYATATGVGRLHAMAGIVSPEDEQAAATYRGNLVRAADRLAPLGIDLLIEPLNGRDVPGYFLASFDQALAIVRSAGRPNLKLQFDLYHRQILHGDVVTGLAQALSDIGHVQIASVPSRNEPDAEELSFPFICATLDRLGYPGHVGCEYRPKGTTLAGLGWFAPFARSR